MNKTILLDSYYYLTILYIYLKPTNAEPEMIPYIKELEYINSLVF